MPDDPRTEEIRARLAAATPGPWEVVTETGGDGFGDWWVYGVKPVCEPHGTDDMAEISAGLDSLDPADAALIANAPADLAYLLDRIDAVRKLHEPIDAVMNPGTRHERLTKVCTGCGTDDGNWQRWPCPTIRALGDHR